MNRGNCYKDLMKPLTAISDYQKAVQLHPNDNERRLFFMNALFEYKEFSEISAGK